MTKLYRPVGAKELYLILDSGGMRFPQRLPEQPFFYPVLNFEYAKEIACNWNTKDENSGYAGYVTTFCVDDDYIQKFEIHVVGASRHQELWVPAEKLAEFNNHISSNIVVLDAFYGEEYQGIASIPTGLKNKNYIEQFLYLKKIKVFNTMDFICELLTHWKVIVQNYFLWTRYDFSQYDLSFLDRDSLLKSIKEILIRNEKWFIGELCDCRPDIYGKNT